MTGLGKKLALVPAGLPLADKETEPVKPPMLKTSTLMMPLSGAQTSSGSGDALIEKSGFGLSRIVMLPLLMSRKILSAHSTSTRPTFVCRSGTVKVCEPSLGVNSAMIWLKFWPRSSDNRMLTLPQLTGA